MESKMNSLKQIIKDGGCKAFDCPACALYTRGLGCALEKHITRKIGTVEQFSRAELDYVKRKLKEKVNDETRTD